MSGSNDDDMDMLAAPPGPRLDHAAMEAHAVRLMATLSERDAIRRRDSAGREASKLADIASGRANMSRRDIAAYISTLAADGDIAREEMREMLRTLPRSAPQIRQWGQKMFAMMMHVGIQGHAVYPAHLFPGPDAQQPDKGGKDHERRQ